MGSLMAGWDIHPADAKKAFNRSRTSLTKDEIDNFWRARRKIMDDHLRDAQKVALARLVVPDMVLDQGSTSTPTTPISGGPSPSSARLSTSVPRSADWWTKSNWAFLNDPPVDVDQGRNKPYIPQFDVARKLAVAHSTNSSAPSV